MSFADRSEEVSVRSLRAWHLARDTREIREKGEQLFSLAYFACVAGEKKRQVVSVTSATSGRVLKRMGIPDVPTPADV